MDRSRMVGILALSGALALLAPSMARAQEEPAEEPKEETAEPAEEQTAEPAEEQPQEPPPDLTKVRDEVQGATTGVREQAGRFRSGLETERQLVLSQPGTVSKKAGWIQIPPGSGRNHWQAGAGSGEMVDAARTLSQRLTEIQIAYKDGKLQDPYSKVLKGHAGTLLAKAGRYAGAANLAAAAAHLNEMNVALGELESVLRKHERWVEKWPPGRKPPKPEKPAPEAVAAEPPEGEQPPAEEEKEVEKKQDLGRDDW